MVSARDQPACCQQPARPCDSCSQNSSSDMRARRKQLIKNQFWINLEDPNLGEKKLSPITVWKWNWNHCPFSIQLMPFKKWKAFLFWTKYQPCVVKIRIQMSLFYYLSGHLSVLDSRVALSLPDCTAHQVSLTFLQWCSDWSAQMLYSYFWMEIKRPPKCKALAPANAVWADVFTVNIFLW